MLSRLVKGRMTAGAGKCLTVGIAVFAFLVPTGCVRKTSGSDSGKRLAGETSCRLDSIKVDFNLFPERWNVDGDILWVVNSRDSLFLTRYNLASHTVEWKGGLIGQGPGEYISPGLVESSSPGIVGLYSNTLNRVDNYASKDTLEKIFTGSFPIWNEGRSLPKPYTRLAAINDSTMVGTYFLPREAGADIIDVKSGRLLSTVRPHFPVEEDAASGPLEFKASVSGDNLVLAYRYVDRVEFYRLDGGEARFAGAVGDSSTQEDLYEADRDDEMVKHYSDVYAVGNKVCLLYQGVQERDMRKSPTHLLVYDMESRSNLANINLGRYFSDMQYWKDSSGSERIVLFDPLSEDYLFVLDLDDSY